MLTTEKTQQQQQRKESSCPPSLDLYHIYSCLAAREVMVPILPLGQKMQLRQKQDRQRAVKRLKQRREGTEPGHLIAAERCSSTQPCAQPSCSMCCAVRPPSPAHVQFMLRGRDSPVRNAMQECWTQAIRGLQKCPEDGRAGHRKESKRQRHRRACDMHKHQQNKLMATIEALDLAASQLRMQLSAAQAAVAPPVKLQDSMISYDSKSGRHAKTRQGTAAAASTMQPSSLSTRRHWIP